MAALLFYLILPLLYFISILPFRILYLMSDGIYFLVYYVFGYRKKVVLENLRNSFPEKSEKEIEQISKKFYKWFCDMLMETLKAITISKKTLLKRVSIKDTSMLEKFASENRSVIIVMGHFGNWELGGARFSFVPFHQLYVIYHPLSNTYFDKLMADMRTRFGNRLYAMKDVMRGMVKNRNELTATTFIADQTPSTQDAFWLTFLNQDTPVFSGTEKISKKFNYPVVYLRILRPKRGYYRIECETIVENPQELADNEISEIHTKALERDIQAHPELWLWTHRRWKHKRKI